MGWRFVMIALAPAVALAMTARAGNDEACAPCGSLSFPEATAFLAARGYPQDEYTVLLTWVETSRAAPRQYVQGYHVLRVGSAEPFDVYSDGHGVLLEAAALARLGVTPKNWGLAPVEAQTEIPPKLAKVLVPRPRPKSASESVAGPALLELPGIPLATVLEEDDAGLSTPNKGVTRIGVFQEFPEPIEVTADGAGLGAWQALPDGGAVWAASIYSPDAKGQRVHFAELALPLGAEVIVYNAVEPNEAYGPYQAVPAGDAGVWSATCFGELVVVECYVPPGVATDGLHVVMDRIVHIYRGFETLQWKSAGWCNLDMSCYPAWATAARAVAGIGTIGSSGSLWCTGSLVTDTDPETSIPFLLAAYHCVPQHGSAATCEFYWLYHTDVCDGTAPDPSTVPRTVGGADLLVGTSVVSGTDFSLLRLRNDPPGGLARLGWTSASQDAGSEVTCIHHPRGDYKRISFGTLYEDPDPCWATPPAASLFLQVVWHDGTTEGGSSGSPMLLSDTGQVVGQLYGGYASCAATECPDYYGRFSQSFPLLRDYLHPFTDLPAVDFSNAEFSKTEDQGVATIAVVLNHGPGTGTASVAYATSNGTARAGTDYTAESGRLTFGPLDFEAAFSVSVLPDTTHEYNETVLLTLSDPQGCVLAGTHNPATLLIVDDDPDSDGDGLSDYDETHGTFGYVTEPGNADTDDDGVDDGTEIEHGTDPTNGAEYPELGSITVPFFLEGPSR